MKTFLNFCAVAMALLFASPAFSFSYQVCNGDTPIKFDSSTQSVKASSVSFPSGYWQNGITDTVNKFNRNPSNFRYVLSMKGGNMGQGNGDSEMWGTTDQGILQGAPAIAYSYWTCYWFFGTHAHMNEVDIAFDYGSPWQWTADTVKSSLIRYTGSGREIQTTGGHELGHGLHLNHVNTEYNIMGQDFTHVHANGSTIDAYIGEDAGNGAVFLYGLRSPAWEDISVSHWEYAGASGQYSTHQHTPIQNSSGGALSTSNVNGETGYNVSPGQVVRAWFTYENNGAHCQSNVHARYVISTNDLITTLDRQIGTGSFNLCRDHVFTQFVTLTIPPDLTHGQNYWLGVILDDNNAISEAVESNNATYEPIHVN